MTRAAYAYDPQQERIVFVVEGKTKPLPAYLPEDTAATVERLNRDLGLSASEVKRICRSFLEKKRQID